MSNKKTHLSDEEKQNPEISVEGMDAEQAAEAAAAESAAQLEAMRRQLTVAQAQADEYKDGWQRSVADFQNYRRRVDAEKENTYQSAVSNIIKSYLPVIDDLERALAARPEGLAWANGIELIYRKLQNILEVEGIKKIEAEGQMFDPNFHEAIGEEPADGVESGTVIGVVRNGYMMGEKVIRPAMVRVAR